MVKSVTDNRGSSRTYAQQSRANPSPQTWEPPPRETPLPRSDGQITTPNGEETAEKVKELDENQAAKVGELIISLQEAIGEAEQALKLSQPDNNEGVTNKDDNHGNILTRPPNATTTLGEQPGDNQQVEVSRTPGKMKKMFEAISNAFSGRFGTIAGAAVFGLVAVGAVALMSAFPPILLFGAFFGLAFAAEMAKPLREFQADLRDRRKKETVDSTQTNDVEEDDMVEEYHRGDDDDDEDDDQKVDQTELHPTHRTSQEDSYRPIYLRRNR